MNNAILISLGAAGLDQRLDHLGLGAQIGLMTAAGALVGGGAIRAADGASHTSSQRAALM